jgi:hypothetical protein
MTKRSLGLTALFILLLSAFFLFKSAKLLPDKKVEVSTSEKYIQSAEPSVSNIEPPVVSNTESDLKRKAEQLFAKIIETRKDLRDKRTVEETRIHKRIREEKYKQFLSSRGVTEHMSANALLILSERDEKLQKLDDAMLDSKISPIDAAKEKNEVRLNAEANLFTTLGPELATEFFVQEKTSRKKK